MTKENSYHIADALKKYLKEEKIDQKFNEKKLISMWEEIMGAPIANRTSGIFIKDKVMYVKLTSAPLKQELNHAKPKVLKLLEEKMGEQIIDDVRFL